MILDPCCSQQPGLGPGSEVSWCGKSGGVSEGHLVLNHSLSWSRGQVPIKLRGCENPMFSPLGSPRITRAAVAGRNTEIVKQLLRKWRLVCTHQIRDSCPGSQVSTNSPSACLARVAFSRCASSAFIRFFKGVHRQKKKGYEPPHHTMGCSRAQLWPPSLAQGLIQNRHSIK